MQDNKLSSSSQKKSPLVSFIVTYHDEPIDLLCECLDSIFALSLPAEDMEVILVDDGSKHSPLAALGEVAEQLIYVRQPNRGLSEARNMGMGMASGLWLQLIDADDRLITPVYETCLDYARYRKVDIVSFLFTRVPTDSSINYDSPLQPISGAQVLHTTNLRASACCYLFRKDILGELRFRPDIYHEDEEFTPQLLLRAEQVQMTEQKAYYYRRRDNSITTSNDLKKQLRRLNDKKSIILRLRTLSDTLPIEERVALQRRVAQLTMDYIYNIILETKSSNYLKRELKELTQLGLFPLPKKDYTMKYKWFQRLSANDFGLQALRLLLPLIKKEQ